MCDECNKRQWIAYELGALDQQGNALMSIGRQLLPDAPLLTIPEFVLAAALFDISACVIAGDDEWLHYRMVEGVPTFAPIADWSRAYDLDLTAAN